jgi:gamma-glutamylcysteine synthetase
MYSLAADRIAKLSRAGLASRLRTGKRGLEKECLRIRRDGSIAQTPHPAASPPTQPRWMRRLVRGPCAQDP